MAIVHLNDENFNDFIKNADKPVLVDFFANWCGPCKMVSPILEEMQDESQDIIIAKVDVDECQDVAREYGVVNIPTLICFKNGEVHKKSIGVTPKDELLELFK